MIYHQIHNEKGQAIFESLLIMPLCILFFIYVVQVLLYFTIEIGIDQTMEDYLLCEVQKRNHCQTRFEKSLADLPLSQTSFNIKCIPPNYTLQLTTTVLKVFSIKKIHHLKYELQI